MDESPLAAPPLPEDPASLEAFRIAFWATGADPSAAPRVHADLVARYAEPHRAYHDLAHVRACLALLREHREVVSDPAALELALWFHDAVYEPLRVDNEARSAALAFAALTDAGAPAAAARVRDLVSLTAGHEGPAGDADGQLLCDLDLAILGASPDEYDRFEAQIRAEYAAFDDATYRAGRRAVLQRFLARPRIFAHPVLFARLEGPARDNLRRALQDLGS